MLVAVLHDAASLKLTSALTSRIGRSLNLVSRSLVVSGIVRDMLVSILDDRTTRIGKASSREVTVGHSVACPLRSGDMPSNSIHISLNSIDLAVGAWIDVVAVWIQVAFTNFGLVGSDDDLTGEGVVASTRDAASRVVDLRVVPALSLGIAGGEERCRNSEGGDD